MKINNKNVLPSQSQYYVNKPKTNKQNYNIKNGHSHGHGQGQGQLTQVEQQIKLLTQ